MQSLIRQALRALEIYADPSLGAAGLRGAGRAAAVGPAARPQPGSDHQLAWAHALLRRRAQRRAHRLPRRPARRRRETVPGLAVDDELRWAIVQTLSARGVIGAERDRRRTRARPVRGRAAARRHRPRACSRPPRPRPRRGAWPSTTTTLPNAMQEAVIAGFAHPLQGELVASVRRAVLRRGRRRVGAAHQRARAERGRRAVPDAGPRRSPRRRSPRPTRSWPDESLALRAAPTGRRGPGGRRAGASGPGRATLNA